MTLADVQARQRAWDGAGVDDYTLGLDVPVRMHDERRDGGDRGRRRPGAGHDGARPPGARRAGQPAGLRRSAVRPKRCPTSTPAAPSARRGTSSGLPRHLVLDPIPNAIDDELDVTIDAFEPTPSS